MALTLKELKSKMDEDEMDLSMHSLTTVPCKELAQLKRASKLDLSCNKLDGLPSEFCQLLHLTKVDLSQNRLSELPAQFGRLANLEHLDLYKNQLEELPLSFASLKKLRWLDVKENPLGPGLAKVAGDCLDANQCKAAANRIVQHMTTLQSELERQRQKRLGLQREEAEKKAAVETRQMKEKQAAKKAEKEKRKQQQPKSQKSEMNGSSGARNGGSPKHGGKGGKARVEEKAPRGVCGLICAFFFVILRLIFYSALAVVVTVFITSGLLYLNCNRAGGPFVRDSKALCGDLEKWAASGAEPKADNVRKAGNGLRAELGDGVTWITTRDYPTLAADSWTAVKGGAVRSADWLQNESVPAAQRFKKNFWTHAAQAGDYCKLTARWTLVRLTEGAQLTKKFAMVAYKQGSVYYAKASVAVTQYIKAMTA